MGKSSGAARRMEAPGSSRTAPSPPPPPPPSSSESSAHQDPTHSDALTNDSTGSRADPPRREASHNYTSAGTADVITHASFPDPTNHAAYLERLRVPSRDSMLRIAAIQERKEAETERKVRRVEESRSESKDDPGSLTMNHAFEAGTLSGALEDVGHDNPETGLPDERDQKAKRHFHFWRGPGHHLSRDVHAHGDHHRQSAGTQGPTAGEPTSEDSAARLIQRHYRGHRERRMLDGLALTPEMRWVEALQEARWRRAVEQGTYAHAYGGVGEAGTGGTDSMSSKDSQHGAAIDGSTSGSTDHCISHATVDGMPNDLTNGNSRPASSRARREWQRLGIIARRAGGDVDHERLGLEADERLRQSETADEEGRARRRKGIEEQVKRQEAAKVMDMQYFLEMVDARHRYGSNLRAYHNEWKRADTKENFFYWLDHGAGKTVTVPGVPRDRLDKEQVRYLSREERLDYLVQIDSEGRLCWAKNGARIDTSARYKDSIHGIVPIDDETPAFTPVHGETRHRRDSSSSATSTASSSSSSSASSLSSSKRSSSSKHSLSKPSSPSNQSRARKYANTGFDQAHGLGKLTHISAATIFNKLLRKSVRKNTWIFVADTHFRLYVGIKQSGAFQHSSFLSAGRISDAGLIRIRDGRLTKLSPLSGHYRPPVRNFRAFVHDLRDRGVDMSRVSISRSYAVLVGLEAYVKTRRRGKQLVARLGREGEKVLHPDEARRRAEAAKDRSQSARMEERFLTEQRLQREREDRERRLERMDRIRAGLKPLHEGDGTAERIPRGDNGVESLEQASDVYATRRRLSLRHGKPRDGSAATQITMSAAGGPDTRSETSPMQRLTSCDPSDQETSSLPRDTGPESLIPPEGMRRDDTG